MSVHSLTTNPVTALIPSVNHCLMSDQYLTIRATHNKAPPVITTRSTATKSCQCPSIHLMPSSKYPLTSDHILVKNPTTALTPSIVHCLMSDHTCCQWV